jgi:uncharacterized protein
MEESIHWNYTTALNIIFLLLAAVSVIRFLRTGGPEMLRMMGGFGHHEHNSSQHAHPDHHA